MYFKITMTFLLALVLAGCNDKGNRRIALPVLNECVEHAKVAIQRLNRREGINASLQSFYIAPTSHRELYGFIDIRINADVDTQDLKVNMDTFEAYCYSDTRLEVFNSVISDEVDNQIDRAINQPYREEGVYVKVSNGKTHIYLNKLDSKSD